MSSLKITFEDDKKIKVSESNNTLMIETKDSSVLIERTELITFLRGVNLFLKIKECSNLLKVIHDESLSVGIKEVKASPDLEEAINLLNK